MSSDYNRKDRFYEQAKAHGYRSRAAYKLMELDSKFGLLRPGMTVADLGAWPGGWMQVAADKIGERGLVVGADLVEIEPLQRDNTHFIHGDLRDEEVLSQMRDAVNGKYDLVLSDMSAKLTGIREADQAAAAGCAELALWVAQQILRPNGNLVMKVFKGQEVDNFFRASRPLFQKLNRVELDSTRKTSNEFYIVGVGLKQVSSNNG